MASIIYLPGHNGLGKRFSAMIGKEVPEKRVEVYCTLEALSRRLCKPTVKVAVLFATDQQILEQILSLGDLMEDVQSILVLADQEKETMSKAHRLRSRYITWSDCDPADILTVFKRMIDLYDIPSVGGR